MSQRLQQLQQQMTKFQYTVDGGAMTNEERQFYEENGFFVVRGMFTADEIKEWTSRFREYADGQLERKYGMQVVRDISWQRKEEANNGVKRPQQKFKTGKRMKYFSNFAKTLRF